MTGDDDDKKSKPDLATRSGGQAESSNVVTHNSTGEDQILEEDQHRHNSIDGEAAGGVARGVGRSLPKVMRGAPIGRLPRRAPVGVMKGGSRSASSAGSVITRQKLPVRRVAKIIDRVSTGLDWFNIAAEETTETTTTTKQQKWLARIGRFGWSLLKNTFLGLAVFESYGYVISSSVLVSSSTSQEYEKAGEIKQHQQLDDNLHVTTTNDPLYVNGSSSSSSNNKNSFEDEVNKELSLVIEAALEPDEYDYASLPLHFTAGGIAGSVHGIFSSVLEGGRPFLNAPTRYMFLNTIHHSFAHSMLFGSYESIKRALIHQIHLADTETQHYGTAYMLAFTLSGGLAGQVQHLVSHYMEYWLGLSNGTLQLSLPFRRSASASPTPVPALRPLLWAFPPSAIGFIAFEYGKKFAD